MNKHCREQKLKLNYGVIYKITNTVNGKIYIGQTIKTIEERWKQHIYKKGCVYLHNAIIKYGVDKFKIDIIENVPIENLDEREVYWIHKYNSTDKEIGYNILLGGKLGRMGKSKLNNEQIQQLIKMNDANIPHTTIAKYFGIERKTVTFVLRRNTSYTKKYKSLQDLDLEQIKLFLTENNPTVQEALNKFKISRSTLFKFTKSIGYRFLSYNIRRKNITFPRVPNNSEELKMCSDLYQ